MNTPILLIKMPGSHVMVKCQGADTLPDRAFEIDNIQKNR